MDLKSEMDLWPLKASSVTNYEAHLAKIEDTLMYSSYVCQNQDFMFRKNTV